MPSKSQILQKLEKLKFAFDTREIPQLHEHEVHPELDIGSRENYLYFIMTCSLNFQRLSPNTWKSALATWNDRETQFVFFPEKVGETSEGALRQALLKHKLALQPQKHIAIWKTLSHTWNAYFQDDPRNLFSQNDFEVAKILEIVQKDMKKDFPYLSGLKLSNYFLFILSKFTDIAFKDSYNISIIPDTHIMQATQVLWILEKNQITPQNVEFAWKELLEGTRYSPVDFHSILWNRSRNKFVPKI